MINLKKYYFSEAVAIKVGVEEAIMLHNIYFWVKHNSSTENNLRDGKYWTYNSTTDYMEQFPFWSAGQIKRIFKNLTNEKLIESGVYNKFKYDRTKWYTTTDIALDIMETDDEYIRNDQSNW